MKCIVCDSEMEYMGKNEKRGGTETHMCPKCLTRYQENRYETIWIDMYGTVFDDDHLTQELKEKKFVIEELEKWLRQNAFKFSFSKLCKMSSILRELE